MNICTIIGRIGKTPETRTTTTGKNVVSFSVAVDNPFDKENATWFSVSAWGQTGDYVSNYLDKGRLVAVSGRMECRKYTKDNQTRDIWELVAITVEGLDRPRDDAPARGLPVPPAADEYDPFADE